MLVVYYCGLEKYVIGTSQRGPLSSTPPFLSVSLERPIDSWLVTSSCVCLRTVYGLLPLKIGSLVDFWGPVQRGMEDVPWSDLFVVESTGRVVPACSSEPCKSAGSALWYLGDSNFLYLFLVNTLLDSGKESKSVGQ